MILQCVDGIKKSTPVIPVQNSLKITDDDCEKRCLQKKESFCNRKDFLIITQMEARVGNE